MSDFVWIPTYKVTAHVRHRPGLLFDLLDPSDQEIVRTAQTWAHKFRPQGKTSPPTIRVRITLYDMVVEDEAGNPVTQPIYNRWVDMVKDRIFDLPETFLLSDLYEVARPFYNQWPNNNTPDDTVRRTCDTLADTGMLIERIAPGVFQKTNQYAK